MLDKFFKKKEKKEEDRKKKKKKMKGRAGSIGRVSEADRIRIKVASGPATRCLPMTL